MKRFRDLAIRTKLTVLLLAVSTAAVLAATLAFYSLVLDQYRHSYQTDLEGLAGILADNCRPALAFQIPEEAVQLLRSIESRPSLVYARINAADGRLFADYGRETTTSKVMAVSQEVTMNGRVIGSLTLQDDMRSIQAFRHYALLTLLTIILLVVGLSFFLATRLRELISQPITDLAGLAEEISRNPDYRLRAEKHGADEIGNLVDSFNKMLAQLGEHNTALENSERRYRALLNQAADAIFLHDLDGRIVDVNRLACDGLGYSREELLTMTVADIDMAEYAGRFKDLSWQKLLPEQPLTIAGIHRRKDGRTLPVEIRLGLLELGGEKLIIALARDISERLAAEKERHHMESRLLQAQKMESIGTLAGGIAHDFNNILTPIIGYLELALMEIPTDQPVRDHLDKVYQAAGRAKEIVERQALEFGTKLHDSWKLGC